MDKVKVGVIGCGAISKRYFSHMCNRFDCLDVVAAADLDPNRAAAHVRLVKTECAKRQIGLAEAPVDIPFEQVIQRILRSGGLVR